jgi:hypothetical protein
METRTKWRRIMGEESGIGGDRMEGMEENRVAEKREGILLISSLVVSVSESLW